MSRRQFVTGALALVVSAVHLPLTAIRGAAGERPDWREAMHAMVGHVQPVEGRVTIETPAVAGVGDPFHLGVSVESPMTEADYVKAVHVFAAGNPDPRIASFYFTPRSGRAMVSTRIRLTQSQNLIAIAEMSDGACYIARRTVKISSHSYTH